MRLGADNRRRAERGRRSRGCEVRGDWLGLGWLRLAGAKSLLAPTTEMTRRVLDVLPWYVRE